MGNKIKDVSVTLRVNVPELPEKFKSLQRGPNLNRLGLTPMMYGTLCGSTIGGIMTREEYKEEVMWNQLAEWFDGAVPE